MDKTERQQTAPQVKLYLESIAREIRDDLYKMLSKTPDDAIQAHYITLALNKVYEKIMTDVNANIRSLRDVK